MAKTAARRQVAGKVSKPTVRRTRARGTTTKAAKRSTSTTRASQTSNKDDVDLVTPKEAAPSEETATSKETVAPKEIAAPKRATPARDKDGKFISTSKRPTTVRPQSLVQRVYRAINTELEKLEKQKGASSQDRERASRALSQMVNSLEKAIDMQREMLKSQTPRAKAKDKEALRHAEDLRRQIAERLERLRPKRRAGGSAQ